MPKRRIRHKGGVPLHVLKTRERLLESLINRRKRLLASAGMSGYVELPGAIPVSVLEKRLHRLKAAILSKE